MRGYGKRTFQHGQPSPQHHAGSFECATLHANRPPHTHKHAPVPRLGCPVRQGYTVLVGRTRSRHAGTGAFAAAGAGVLSAALFAGPLPPPEVRKWTQRAGGSIRAQATFRDCSSWQREQQCRRPHPADPLARSSRPPGATRSTTGLVLFSAYGSCRDVGICSAETEY